MVRKLQVDAAGVDVDGLAQVGGGHRRAFDMPARTAPAPRRFPTGQVVAGRLPQHEIARVTLVRGHVDAGTGQHFVRVAARKLAVAVEAGHREQHVALGGIGMPIGDELLDHGDDLRHVRGHFRLDVRRHHAQRGHVFTVGGGEAVGDGADRHLLARGGVDLVVHVGDVAGVAQCAETAPQQVGQHPEHHRATGVADVHVVVDRRAAHIQGRTGRVERDERFELASQVVVQAQGHGAVAGDKPVILERVAPLWGTGCHRWTPVVPGWGGQERRGRVMFSPLRSPLPTLLPCPCSRRQ